MRMTEVCFESVNWLFWYGGPHDFILRMEFHRRPLDAVYIPLTFLMAEALWEIVFHLYTLVFI